MRPETRAEESGHGDQFQYHCKGDLVEVRRDQSEAWSSRTDIPRFETVSAEENVRVLSISGRRRLDVSRDDEDFKSFIIFGE